MGIAHRNLVFIEGGLGSQILNIISFWTLQEKIGSTKAKCNLSYFRSATSGTHWPWELGNFNISLNSLESNENNSKFNLLKPKRDWIDKESLDSNFWQKARSEYSHRFKFDENATHEYFESAYKISLPSKFGTVHVRRGDYLNVASKIITSEEYFEFFERIANIFPETVFFISDSLFSDNEKRQIIKILSSKRKIIFLDGPNHDSFKVHCLMRMSEVLVTSNSTYSFSAGLLGKSGQKVFSPINFHSGPLSAKYNAMFQSTADFVVWRSLN